MKNVRSWASIALFLRPVLRTYALMRLRSGPRKNHDICTKLGRFSLSLLAIFFLTSLSLEAHATDIPTTASSQLQKCLQRADDLPDIAAAEATVWIKKDNSNEAHYCHAVAQSNRSMHADSAREFWFLASYYDKRGDARAILMHGLSAQEFMRAKDTKNAEGQYTAALKMAPNDQASLLGRAETRMAMEKYWDAIADLNRTLKIKPNDVVALRQRGRAWLQLGDDKNAQEDFANAADMDAPPPQK